MKKACIIATLLYSHAIPIAHANDFLEVQSYEAFCSLNTATQKTSANCAAHAFVHDIDGKTVYLCTGNVSWPLPAEPNEQLTANAACQVVVQPDLEEYTITASPSSGLTPIPGWQKTVNEHLEMTSFTGFFWAAGSTGISSLRFCYPWATRKNCVAPRMIKADEASSLILDRPPLQLTPDK